MQNLILYGIVYFLIGVTDQKLGSSPSIVGEWVKSPRVWVNAEMEPVPIRILDRPGETGRLAGNQYTGDGPVYLFFPSFYRMNLFKTARS
jgi:hypothetical protein